MEGNNDKEKGRKKGNKEGWTEKQRCKEERNIRQGRRKKKEGYKARVDKNKDIRGHKDKGRKEGRTKNLRKTKPG